MQGMQGMQMGELPGASCIKYTVAVELTCSAWKEKDGNPNADTPSILDLRGTKVLGVACVGHSARQ